MGSGLGFGCTTVTTKIPIMNDQDLRDIIDIIKEKKEAHHMEITPLYITILNKENK